MPLDAYIEGDELFETDWGSIPYGVDPKLGLIQINDVLHSEIVRLAENRHAKVVLRAKDFYADAFVKSDEISAYRHELEAFLEDKTLPYETSCILNALLIQANLALRLKRGVVFIAD